MDVLDELISAAAEVDCAVAGGEMPPAVSQRLTEAARAAGAGAWLADVMLPLAVRALASNIVHDGVREAEYVADIDAALADVAAAADAARENDAPDGVAAAMLALGHGYLVGVFDRMDPEIETDGPLDECDYLISAVASDAHCVAESLLDYEFGERDRILCLVACALMLLGDYDVVGSAAASATIRHLNAGELSRDAVIAFVCRDSVRRWLASPAHAPVKEAIAAMLEPPRVQIQLPPVII